jgi:hypothetical protein
MEIQDVQNQCAHRAMAEIPAVYGNCAYLDAEHASC